MKPNLCRHHFPGSRHLAALLSEMELTMKKGIALLLAAGSVAAITVPAAAQDGDRGFTGAKIEALVGYDSNRPGSTVDIDNADDVDQSIDGVTYGLGVGYDYDMGSAVIGVEGEYMRSEADTDYDTTGFTTYGISNIDAGRDLYIGARVGAKVTPRTLAYVKGGYANAKMDVLTTDNTTDTQTDLNLDGWRAGAGVEHQVSGNIYVKGEYRYSQYQEGEVEAPSGLESDRFDVDLDRHQFVVGVGARF
jgi:outer membrane immunogenic protein